MNKDDFNVYLNEDMTGQWEAYQRFLEAAKELKKYGASGTMHLVKYAPDLQFNNLDVCINWYPYQEVAKPKSDAA